EGSAFARATETERTGARPGKHVAGLVGDGDDRIVERSLNEHDTRGYVFLFALLKLLFLAAFSGAFCLCLSHSFLCISCGAPTSSAWTCRPPASRDVQEQGKEAEPLTCRPFSCWPPCRAAVPCGCGNWCACAGHGRVDRDDDASRDRSPFQSG